MSDIDISTHSLAEKTANAMKHKATVDQILAMWHSAGNVIKDQMISKKGVRLPSLGTFSFTNKGEVVFAMSTELGKQFNLRQHVTGHPDNTIPATMLNFSAVRAGTKIPRDMIDKMYTKLMVTLGRCLAEGRSILLTVHRVAEITIGNGRLKCDFFPKFLDQIHQISNSHLKTGKQRDMIRTIAKQTALDLSGDYDIANRNQSTIFNDDIQRTTERPAKKAGQRSGNWNRNPITGAGDDYDDNEDGLYPRRRGGNNNRQSTTRQRPASAGRAGINARQGSRASNFNDDTAVYGRRPSSAGSNNTLSTRSLMNSPGFNNRTTGYGRVNGVNKNGLRKEELDRHNKTMHDRPSSRGRREATADPRAIAAKALDVGNVVEQVRKKIVARGGSNGIRGISKLLSIMDDNGDKRLSKDELRYGLRDYGIDLSPTELEQVFMYFDRDGNGFIDCTEFLVGLRGDMPESRKKFVRMAFDILDKDKSGIIEPEEILSVYDFTWHPSVREGKKTVQEAAREFMNAWDRNDKDGLITFDEFLDYYKEVSASIDDDSYFELMMRNAWRIAGGSGAAANTANRRVLVTNKDGSQRVETINNELGIRGGDKEEMTRRLRAQGVEAQNIDLYGGFDDTKKRSKTQAPNGVASRLNRPSSRGYNATAPAPVHERHKAASQLAAAFRGRKGRKEAAQHKRYADAERRAQYEEEMEQQIPRARQISRPKGNSYIGF